MGKWREKKGRIEFKIVSYFKGKHPLVERERERERKRDKDYNGTKRENWLILFMPFISYHPTSLYNT